jgi:hypothetical protein
MRGELEKEMMKTSLVKKDKLVGGVFSNLEKIKERLQKDMNLTIDFQKEKESVKLFLIENKLEIPNEDMDEVANGVYNVYIETVAKVPRAEAINKFKLKIHNREYKSWHKKLEKAKNNTDYDRVMNEWKVDVEKKAIAEFEAWKRDGFSKVLDATLPKITFCANKGETVKRLAKSGDGFAQIYSNMEGMNGWTNLKDANHNKLVDW